MNLLFKFCIAFSTTSSSKMFFSWVGKAFSYKLHKQEYHQQQLLFNLHSQEFHHYKSFQTFPQWQPEDVYLLDNTKTSITFPHSSHLTKKCLQLLKKLICKIVTKVSTDSLKYQTEEPLEERIFPCINLMCVFTSISTKFLPIQVRTWPKYHHQRLLSYHIQRQE